MIGSTEPITVTVTYVSGAAANDTVGSYPGKIVISNAVGTSNPNVPLGPYITPGTTLIPGQPWWGTGTGPTLYNGTGGTTTSTGYIQVNQGPTATTSTTTYTSLLDKLETK